MTRPWDPDPFDPDLDRPCTSCRAGFHAACFGCWRWCPCACGLDGPNDPLREPSNN